MNSTYMDFTIGIAERAGANLLKYHDQSLEAEWTSATHFKTIVDDKNDLLARDMIRAEYPTYGIHSEEGAPLNPESRYRWVVDGVDGTIDFSTGFTDHFSFAIALCDGPDPILGVINAAGRNELYHAEKNEGAFRNRKPIHVSALTNINQVLMWVGSGKQNRRAHLPFLDRLLQPEGITCPLMTGCASVPLCLVASGVIHAFLATSLAPEDMAAAVIIIREAGGEVTNLSGDEWRLGDPDILAANPILHETLLEFLRAERRAFER